jgi:prophage tail gpP-like protein
MPTPDNEVVSLSIGGRTHAEWESYEIDSDLLVPADAWHVSLGLNGKSVPAEVVIGAEVLVKVGGETVLTGYVDDVGEPISKSGHTLSLSGRDRAADLLDCACPIFNKQEATLSQIVAAIATEFGDFNKRIDADSVRSRKKIAVDIGVTAWDALARVAESNGLWPWFEPDGTLVVGGPDYSTPEVATLILRRDGDGNNVLSLDKQESMAERYSKVTVYSQAPGSHSGGLDSIGKPDVSGFKEDTTVKRNRPHVVIDNECDTPAACRSRATKLLNDGKLKSFTLSAEVKGHRIAAPGSPSDGMLWKPGQRVRVISDPHGINGVFFLMARKFKRNRSDGTRTELTLKEDGVWAIEAHPHSKHARGKNSLLGHELDWLKAPNA